MQLAETSIRRPVFATVLSLLIVLIVRGVRRMDAQEGYRARGDAVARITQEEKHG